MHDGKQIDAGQPRMLVGLVDADVARRPCRRTEAVRLRAALPRTGRACCLRRTCVTKLAIGGGGGGSDDAERRQPLVGRMPPIALVRAVAAKTVFTVDSCRCASSTPLQSSPPGIAVAVAHELAGTRDIAAGGNRLATDDRIARLEKLLAARETSPLESVASRSESTRSKTVKSARWPTARRFCHRQLDDGGRRVGDGIDDLVEGHADRQAASTWSSPDPRPGSSSNGHAGRSRSRTATGRARSPLPPP